MVIDGNDAIERGREVALAGVGAYLADVTARLAGQQAEFGADFVNQLVGEGLMELPSELHGQFQGAIAYYLTMAVGHLVASLAATRGASPMDVWRPIARQLAMAQIRPAP